ncbi:hypothetical protein ONS87_06900 [Caldimonas thermodepolymerans]|uniref:CRISPR type IV-associated protein Csf1 n=2 Tax=Caldimonas thermodepolymerans TaxID=215580 RepID=A0AA46HVI8_9BURK|nr:hypothetical protein [Caldimonas thermodepolymerans]TCP06601.1 CRISPR type IV-associated protein Csf1 [Caldimonas thermodepolymerans]UZG49341.1 hypothetical protein ONS87_06900 [Caldimonas thermodepolymerans]
MTDRYERIREALTPQMTPTQFAWRSLQCGDFPPPDVKRGERFGPDAECWLCGGDTRGVGWPLKTGLAPTFTDFPRAKCQHSTTVCQECVAMSQSEGWVQYVRAHPERGFAEAFPAKEGKKTRYLNWLYSSHMFTQTMHETPDRRRIRELLLCPPAPPFLLVIAVSGQKQIIFKGQVADSREHFPVQADDERVYVERESFAQMLADFEAMYAMGFSKETIANDRDWNQARILHIGIGAWRQANARMARWRRSRPDWVMLAAHCAQRPVDWVDPMKTTPREAAGTVVPPPKTTCHTPDNSLQQELF